METADRYVSKKSNFKEMIPLAQIIWGMVMVYGAERKGRHSIVCQGGRTFS
jgi:hypothetical protein